MAFSCGQGVLSVKRNLSTCKSAFLWFKRKKKPHSELLLKIDKVSKIFSAMARFFITSTVPILPLCHLHIASHGTYLHNCCDIRTLYHVTYLPHMRCQTVMAKFICIGNNTFQKTLAVLLQCWPS